MNARTRRLLAAGPAGNLECAIDDPATDPPRGVAVVCHPHPLFGGTLDNKVALTLARAFVLLGFRSVRFNFRGVGQSQGVWDEGRGEIDDAAAVVQQQHLAGRPLVLAGFSFGGHVAANAARRLPDDLALERLVLVGPAVDTFDVGSVRDDTLVIQGEADDVVSMASVLAWARPQSLPVVVLPGAGHFFHGQLPALRQIVVRAWPALPVC